MRTAGYPPWTPLNIKGFVQPIRLLLEQRFLVEPIFSD